MKRVIVGRTKTGKPKYKNVPTSMKEVVQEAGGTLIRVVLPRIITQNGGCGCPTYVSGTNGGQMPCGAMLTVFGKTEPYYCGACQEKITW